MNQRMRILKLLQEGKISLEQAEHLLEMMDQKSSAADRGGSFDRWNLRELRQLGTQITSAVSQSLSDVRKTIEQQVEQWTGPWTQHTLSVSTVVSVPEGFGTCRWRRSTEGFTCPSRTSPQVTLRCAAR
ncbi:hypothetical protein GCM10025857_33530 [Alicyclobacillus contaminans]|nr:hypothetical protein GCM10025857_33530 [Alicyclobacillus contaminans]